MLRHLTLLTAVLCCSCGGSDSRPAVHPVRGSVFFDGRPAPGARVIFHPIVGAGDSFSPHGVVGEDGFFRLSTFNAYDGAPEGAYRVSVYWRKPNPEDDEEEGPNLLPARYLSPATSGLKAEVKPQDNQLEPFNLIR